MVIKKILVIILMILLVSTIVSAFGVYPTINFHATDVNPVDTTTLVASAYDLYDNAGIDWIRIYEDDNVFPVEDTLIGEKDCKGDNLCMFSPVILHSAPGSVDYYAEAEDKSGNVETSETVTVVYTGTPNTPPILDVIGDKSVNEVDTLSFVISATDVDVSDTLTLTADLTQLPTINDASFNIDTFTWTPTYDDAGEYVVRFEVDDNRLDGVDFEEVTITVNNINRAPVFSGVVSDQYCNEDINLNGVINLKTYFSDPDLDSLTYSVSGNTNIDVEIVDGIVSLSPSIDWSGFEDVIFIAEDDEDFVESNIVSLTVNPINDDAVWEVLTEKNIDFNPADGTVVYPNLKQKCTDVDDTINMVITSTHTNFDLNFDGDDLVINNLIARWVGTETVDLDCNTMLTSFDLIINPNAAPIIELIDDFNIVADEEVVLTVVASDVDGDVLTYTIDNVNFVQDVNVFTWDTTYDDFGVYSIIITVDDGAGELNSVVQESFTLTVDEDSDEDGIPDYLETLVISFKEPDDGDEIFVGETIEGELKIKNTGSSDVDADIEIVLFDETDDDEIEEIEFDRDIEGDESETFGFEFDLDYDLDESHTYVLYARVNDGDNSYYKEIDLDVERKSHDIVVEDMRVHVVGDKLEVLVGLLNQGKKDEEVYIELDIIGLNLGKTSERFSLGDWESDNNQMYKKFVFDLDYDVEAGMYDAEATIHYGAKFDYVRRGFEIVRAPSGNIQIIEGSLERPQMTSGSDSSFELLTMKNITWGIVDFLLLCVVIYVFVWLIKKD